MTRTSTTGGAMTVAPNGMISQWRTGHGEDHRVWVSDASE
jgi:hypothetical protein